MNSIIVLTRQLRPLAAQCLSSIMISAKALHLENAVEYIFIDDNSDPQAGMIDLLKEMRSYAASVQIVRFREHRHYAYGMALALSLATGDNVLFFSHDMIVAPACLGMLLEVAGAELSVGIVRARSQHMDYNHELEIAAPPGTRNFDQIAAFSQSIAQRFGRQFVKTKTCIGDCMLIKRAVIDAIGVFDTRFFGLMSDVDYGLRALRAGFAFGVATGAWLFHIGAAVAKIEVASGKPDPSFQIRDAFKLFREKWDPSLPSDIADISQDDLLALSTINHLTASEYQPPIPCDAAICEVL